jgi:hypothetical protein
VRHEVNGRDELCAANKSLPYVEPILRLLPQP